MVLQFFNPAEHGGLLDGRGDAFGVVGERFFAGGAVGFLIANIQGGFSQFFAAQFFQPSEEFSRAGLNSFQCLEKDGGVFEVGVLQIVYLVGEFEPAFVFGFVERGGGFDFRGFILRGEGEVGGVGSAEVAVEYVVGNPDAVGLGEPFDGVVVDADALDADGGADDGEYA